MTPERFARLNTVLDARQPDLTVLMDNVHKPHNLSAILRSCDAVGILTAHAVWPGPRMRVNHMTAGGVRRWLAVRTHPDVMSAIATLDTQGLQVVAAHRCERAVDFREVDYTRPTALLLGSERHGVSREALDVAALRVCVPMLGMGESLNVSVAAATILFEAQRQRIAAGMYAACRIDPDCRRRILFRWAHPQLARYCERHDLAYPALDDNGDLAEPLARPDRAARPG